MRHLENRVKSFRTSISQGRSHSKKTPFRCPLAYPRESGTIPLFHLSKDIEIRANSKILDLKGSWETSLCLTDGKKMEKSKIQIGWTSEPRLDCGFRDLVQRQLYPAKLHPSLGEQLSSSPNHYQIPPSTSHSAILTYDRILCNV